jgi:hypothetical protein
VTCVGSAADGLGTDYEQLRSGMLDGAPRASHFGLVILMREGVAAWMAHAWARARPATVVQGVANDRPSAAALIADDIHADMVAVLASMVMTTHGEKCA